MCADIDLFLFVNVYRTENINVCVDFVLRRFICTESITLYSFYIFSHKLNLNEIKKFGIRFFRTLKLLRNTVLLYKQERNSNFSYIS